jgi:hypothetical protein
MEAFFGKPSINKSTTNNKIKKQIVKKKGKK